MVLKEDLRQWKETCEVLSDKAALKALKKSMQNKKLKVLEIWANENKDYHIALSIPIKEFNKKIKELKKL